jgi:hypothetical protein
VESKFIILKDIYLIKIFVTIFNYSDTKKNTQPYLKWLRIILESQVYYYFIFLFCYYSIIFINVKIYLIATSAPAERIFSSEADVITYDRARLAPETVRAVMCLKHWYKSGFLD